jgi:hypothetical protein
MPLNELLLAKVMNKANLRRVVGRKAINNSEVNAEGGDGCLSHYGRNYWNIAGAALQGSRSRSGECACNGGRYR